MAFVMVMIITPLNVAMMEEIVITSIPIIQIVLLTILVGLETATVMVIYIIQKSVAMMEEIVTFLQSNTQIVM